MIAKTRNEDAITGVQCTRLIVFGHDREANSITPMAFERNGIIGGSALAGACEKNGL